MWYQYVGKIKRLEYSGAPKKRLIGHICVWGKKFNKAEVPLIQPARSKVEE